MPETCSTQNVFYNNQMISKKFSVIDTQEQSYGVAICTYNGAAYLKEQLDSISSQTIKPKQVVLSDDGSTDSSIAIAKEWKKKIAEPLNIQTNIINNRSPLGISKNFEQACSKLTTDIIFLSDQDDIWPPEKALIFMEKFKNDRILLAHSNAELIDARGEKLKVTLFDSLRLTNREKKLIQEKSFFDIYLSRNIVTGAACAFQRHLFELSRPFPEHWLHDEWLATIASISGDIELITTPLLKYRQHGMNIVGAPINFLQYLKLIMKKTGRNNRIKKLENKIKKMCDIKNKVKGNNYKKNQDFLEQKIKSAKHHFETRKNLSANVFTRAFQIRNEIKTNNYFIYSKGIEDIFRDIADL